MQIHMHKDGMKQKNLVVLLAILLTGSCFTQFIYVEPVRAVEPKFYVDDDYDSSTPGWHYDHFDKIQDAIDNATTGDRIIVYEGIYYENLIVNKSVDIFAEDRDNTIIDGGNNGNVVTISVTYVNISTFTIRNSGNSENNAVVIVNAGYCKIVDNIIKAGIQGIFINNSNGNTIAYNALTKNDYGMFLYSSDSNIINYNEFYDNSNNGIFLNETCDSNSISNNDIYENTDNGIYLHDHCDQNIITNNDIYQNGNTGIRIENSSSNEIISNNIMENTQYGIIIAGSSNEVNGNTISGNEKHGVFLLADDENVISDNIISSNTLDGIRLQNSTNDIISGNRITENSHYGVYLNYYAIGNKIYNNYFENNDNNSRDISNSLNLWNRTKTNGSNIINGPYLGGNYWDDYKGTDSNGDGIVDVPYNINGGSSQDKYPLMNRPPVADAGGPYHGSIGEKIPFYGSGSVSPDGAIASYTWSFGDGGTEDGEDVSHNYSSKGNYTVTLTVVNTLGGTNIDTTYALIDVDTEPPSINIDQHDSSSTDLTNIYTFSAYITDNVGISNVTMEYWYDSNIDHITADMNYKGNNYYEKFIIPEGKPDRVYCIIFAIDISGNENNTMNPIAHIDAKDSVNISETIAFDASESFDLDGEIVNFSWDFGDGTKGFGITQTHTYAADGRYKVTLTVTDRDERTGVDTANVEVIVNLPKEASNNTLNWINNNAEYNVNLTKPFLCYDLDNDGEYDTFYDPNRILKLVNNPVNINGYVSFLISVDDSSIPDFFWTPETDYVTTITHAIGTFDDDSIVIDEKKEQAIINIIVNKANWIYIEVDDTKYPDLSITVKTGDRTISSDMIWRKNNKIYVLDDPTTKYQFIFENIYPEVKPPAFSPVDGGVIDENSTIITVSYNVPVSITFASFGSLQVKSNLVTTDNKVFTYSPLPYLKNGTYAFEIAADALEGNSSDTSSAVYFYFAYATPPQKNFIEENWMFITISLIIGALAAALILYKYNLITINDFIYIKNKKILPFFRTIIFGQVSVNVDNTDIAKAEFYVDNKLKETLTSPPYLWKWNEKAFLKHTLETKVYDQEGNSASSGEMTFYAFNPFKR